MGSRNSDSMNTWIGHLVAISFISNILSTEPGTHSTSKQRQNSLVLQRRIQKSTGGVHFPAGNPSHVMRNHQTWTGAFLFTVLVSRSRVSWLSRTAYPFIVSRATPSQMESIQTPNSLTELSCMYRILYLTSFRLFGLTYWLLGFGAD